MYIRNKHIHLHDKTLTLPIHEHLQLHVSQYKQKTQHPSHPLHKYTPYFNTPRLKKHYFNNGRYTTNIPTDPHTVTTTDIKTSMRHIHTSIVSRHLAPRANNKLAELKRYFSASLVAPFPNSGQTNLLPQIIRTQSRRHITSITTIPPLQHPHHHFNVTHIRTALSPLDLWTEPAGVIELLVRWRDKLAGGPKVG